MIRTFFKIDFFLYMDHARYIPSNVDLILKHTLLRHTLPELSRQVTYMMLYLNMFGLASDMLIGNILFLTF